MLRVLAEQKACESCFLDHLAILPALVRARNHSGLVHAHQEGFGFSAALRETTEWGRWLLWSSNRGCRPRVTPRRAQ
eukprot:6894742-Pyramimonas_sp.AAC.1